MLGQMERTADGHMATAKLQLDGPILAILASSSLKARKQFIMRWQPIQILMAPPPGMMSPLTASGWFSSLIR